MSTILKNFKLKHIEFRNLNLKYILPSLILGVFFLSEFVSKYLKINNYDFIRVSGVIKLTAEILILMYVFKKKKANRIILLKILMFFTILYVFGQLVLNTVDFFDRFIYNLYSVNGYLFIFILYFALKPEKSADEEILTKQLFYLDTALKSIFICNAVLILFGLIFQIAIFKTYLGFSDRFGYNGLFLHASHSSYIYIIFILYFLIKHFNKQNGFSLLFLSMAITTSLIIGTKTLYLFNLLLLLFVVIKSLKPYISLLLISITVICVLNFISVFEDLLNNYFGVLYDVYREHGLFTMLFSYRDISITDTFIPYILENWSILNYLIGGANFFVARTEIEIIDLFWFWGIIGAFVYIKLIYTYFFKAFLFDKKFRFPIFFLILCILLSGSFFTNAPVIPYFIILCFAFKIKLSKADEAIENQLTNS